MRIKLILLSCLVAINGIAQEVEEHEYDANYYVMNNVGWKIEEIIPDEDNIALDTLTKITYNPLMNLDILDSINSYRIANDVAPIEYEYEKEYSKQLQAYTYYAMDMSKVEKAPVLLTSLADPEPGCDCVSSVFKMIIDDSLEFTLGKRSYILKDRLLDKQIKRISVDYYQVRQNETPNEHDQHVVVTIWKKHRWLSITYPVL